LSQHGQEVRRFGEQRQKLENQVVVPSAAAVHPAKSLVPATGKLPVSPIVAGPSEELGKDHVPPQMHVAPRADLRVEAKPRATPSPEQPQRPTVNRLPLETPKPEPRVERPAPKREPAVERSALQPKAQAERPAPQPQPQPKVDRPAAQPAAHPPLPGPGEDKRKEKGKDK
jgi:hypothetical protein